VTDPTDAPLVLSMAKMEPEKPASCQQLNLDYEPSAITRRLDRDTFSHLVHKEAEEGRMRDRERVDGVRDRQISW